MKETNKETVSELDQARLTLTQLLSGVTMLVMLNMLAAMGYLVIAGVLNLFM